MNTTYDPPGHLKPIFRMTEWLDLFYKSQLSAEHKLVGSVVARTCSYNRKQQLQLSSISNYSISRILNMTQDSVQKLLDDLVKYGWLFDTNKRIGARKVYALTFSLLPMGDPKI